MVNRSIVDLPSRSNRVTTITDPGSNALRSRCSGPVAVLGGLAEFERELIKARTMEGRERAKRAGVKMGRKPLLSPHQIAEIRGRKVAVNPSISWLDPMA